MINSKEYARRVRKLYRELKHKYPTIERTTYDEPVDAIVHGIISENITETAAQAMSRKFADYFVDLNDMRVSRPEEMVEILGEDTHITRQTTNTLTSTLMAIFNEYHMVSLQALKKIGKRPAKKALEKLDGITRFAVDYCMLMALQGHAIPLTGRMIEYLKSHELVDSEVDEQQIEGFLTRQISAKNGYEFYTFLRRESEASEAKKKKRTTHRAKTRKKTKRKK
jgi:endonuclease III